MNNRLYRVFRRALLVQHGWLGNRDRVFNDADLATLMAQLQQAYDDQASRELHEQLGLLDTVIGRHFPRDQGVMVVWR